jgi:hypothetical protein
MPYIPREFYPVAPGVVSEAFAERVVEGTRAIREEPLSEETC